MKKLTDFAEEINKCSNCGKCQEICPIYKLTGNDCAVSKGKFVMLKGVLKGDLKLSKTINKYLDLCLKCGKCKDFCPSGIDACEIFNCAKSEYVKTGFYGKLTRLLQSRTVFNGLFRLGKIFPRVRNDLKGKTKLLYFKGCVNNLFPTNENTVKKILKNFDVELIEKDFDCCGLPFLSSGNAERFEMAKNHNLELMKTECDYVITDCASCESTLRDYGTDLNIVNICHFLAIQKKKFVFDKPLKVTFHKPCHLKSDAFLKPLLEKCENVEYIQAEGYDECCGFAGEFAIRNPKISLQMTRKKAKNLLDTGADIILTACPACTLGIQQGMLGQGNKRIMNLVEFIAMSKILDKSTNNCYTQNRSEL